jgi:glycogen(starch) synthase
MLSRVLMTSDSIGSVWTYALDLCRALGERGIEVVLATTGRALTQEQQREVWSVDTLTLHEQRLRSEWMEDPWQDVAQMGEALLALESRYEPDVVHINGYAHAALPFRAKVVSVAQSCVLSWWESTRGAPFPRELSTYRQRAREGLHAADAVVCSTQSRLLELTHHYGPLHHSRVIPQGCDPSRVSPARKEELVISSGRSWDTSMNEATLAAAALQVPWPVAVARDDLRPPYRSPAMEPQIPDPLRHLGKLARGALWEWLSRASIYALSVRYEPDALSVLEPALAGCALVLSDIPSLRERWEGAALFFPPGDGDALARILTELSRDRTRCEERAELARTRALSCSLQRSAERYIELYRELMEPSGPRVTHSPRA